MAIGTVPRVALAAALLTIPCAISGRPQVFSDTKAYYALGQEAALAFGRSHGDETTQALRGRTMTPAQTRDTTRLAYTVAASRSPYWSLLFYLATRLGGAWLVVVAQALVAAGALWIAIKGFGVQRAYWPIVAALACLSSLPVEVMFLMPDLFAGLTVLAALSLAFRRDRLERRDVVALWLVMTAGALFHVSHLLALAGLGAGTALVTIARRRSAAEFRPALLMLSAAAIGVVGALAFPVAVRAARHETIYAPPFVAVRLIADGPGRALLREDCRTADAWGWCPYLDKPLDDVNTILWDAKPAVASFQAADYARRVRIIGEQPRFVLAVLRRYPGQVAETAWNNVWRLFLQYRTGETLGDPTDRYRDPTFAVFSRIVPGSGDCARGRASCASRLDLPLVDAVIGLTLLASGAAIVWTLGDRRRRRAWLGPVLFLLAGLCLNALVCGVISGDAERYQSRITWLVPLMAGAMLAERLMRRSVRRRAPHVSLIG